MVFEPQDARYQPRAFLFIDPDEFELFAFLTIAY